ncbi:MAG: leucine--tRNA ligase [Candidatus Omnitrophota bacterium]|nr:leucine--tRNA ligase [Candidatus Omnitrophota bacterium]
MDYNKQIDKKWQDFWKKEGLFKVDTKGCSKDKYYCLVMFPYPSSELHVGHARNYVIGDAVVRYKMMQGLEVLSPMGWDAFGLPAENQAIKRKIHPREWTLKNIDRIKQQLDSWGIGYDWDREVTTCLPDYYKWTQWIFLQLYKAGLAYKKEAYVNWCSSCKTVLANEQVIDGVCERCSTQVDQKKLNQWFFKITDYADRLLKDLDFLSEWPDRVKSMQQNWIGKSWGVEINFSVQGYGEKIECFTTRVDTIFGATFLALNWEHPILDKILEDVSNKEEIKIFIEKLRNQPPCARLLDSSDKEGIFTGKYALNSMTGKKIPIWVANYILTGYGTGAIMCVPSHDLRDYEFAKKYDLPIIEVIKRPKTEDRRQRTENGEEIDDEDQKRNQSSEFCHRTSDKEFEVYEGEGVLVNSGEFNGLSSEEAKNRIVEYMENKGIGKKAVNYKLRDWLISRQRYWGAPIPIVYCLTCGEVAVPLEDLPVTLPQEVEFLSTGQSPLTYVQDFIKTKCPKCGKEAKRETDTMDTFVDSSWYYLRYLSPKEENIPFDKEEIIKWQPVDQYIGGVEHAILHLMYSRFIYKFLIDIDSVKTEFPEPFKRLFTQGMIVKDGAKMSKSKGNVVAPDYIIEKYGADTMRLYILFMGPPQKDAEWQDEGVSGCWRFIQRCLRLVDMFKEYKEGDTADSFNECEKAVVRKMHSTIREVTADLEGNFQFNTAISRIMELVNQTYKSLSEGELRKEIFKQALETVFLLLAPFTPHISEEVNKVFGNDKSIFSQAWPRFDEKHLHQEEVEVAVLVNGKVRDKMKINVKWAKEDIEQKALALAKVLKVTANRTPKKIIYIEKKIVNIVI